MCTGRRCAPFCPLKAPSCRATVPGHVIQAFQGPSQGVPVDGPRCPRGRVVIPCAGAGHQPCTGTPFTGDYDSQTGLVRPGPGGPGLSCGGGLHCRGALPRVSDWWCMTAGTRGCAPGLPGRWTAALLVGHWAQRCAPAHLLGQIGGPSAPEYVPWSPTVGPRGVLPVPFPSLCRCMMPRRVILLAPAHLLAPCLAWYYLPWVMHHLH